MSLFQKPIIFHTRIASAVFVEQAPTAVLFGPYDGDVKSLESSSAESSVQTHDEEGVLAFSHVVGVVRVTFLLDMWSQTTFGFFSKAKRDGFIFVGFAGEKEQMCIAPALEIWTTVLAFLQEYQTTTPRRSPADFIRAAFSAEMLAKYAVHPGRPDGCTPSGEPGSQSITVMLANEHLELMGVEWRH
jgi:hypothetical protein